MKNPVTNTAHFAFVLCLLAGGAGAQTPTTVPGPELQGGRVVMPDGREMSQVEFMRGLLGNDKVKLRDAEGNLIDSSAVTVEDDGTLRRRDGSVVNLRRAPALQPGASASDSGGLQLITPETAGAAEQESARPPPAAGGGIPVILGGKGKDGAAQIGRIPVLK